MAYKQLMFGAEAREKVLRIALENAVSVASVLLLTEATLTELPEEKPTSAQPAEVM